MKHLLCEDQYMMVDTEEKNCTIFVNGDIERVVPYRELMALVKFLKGTYSKIPDEIFFENITKSRKENK